MTRKFVRFLSPAEFQTLSIQDRLTYLNALEKAATEVREQVLRSMVVLGRDLMDSGGDD